MFTMGLMVRWLRLPDGYNGFDGAMGDETQTHQNHKEPQVVSVSYRAACRR